MQQSAEAISKQSWSIAEFGERHGISQTTVYKLISTGTLEARKIGRRTVVPKIAEEAWLASLPARAVNRSAA